MDSPNGDHRLAKAISFLINRINSAMLNHNDSNKNSWCDNQSAPKTFITIIFISRRGKQWQWVGWYWRRISALLVITLELAADMASALIDYKTRGHREHSLGFILDSSLDVGPFSDGGTVVRNNKHFAFWSNTECETRPTSTRVGWCAEIHLPNSQCNFTTKDLINSWKNLAEKSCLLIIKLMGVHTKAQIQVQTHKNAHIRRWTIHSTAARAIPLATTHKRKSNY